MNLTTPHPAPITLHHLPPHANFSPSTHQHPTFSPNHSSTPIKKLSDEYFESLQRNRKNMTRRNASVEVKYRFIYRNACSREERGKENYKSEKSVKLEERAKILTPSKNSQIENSVSTNHSSKVKKLSELRKKIIKNLSNAQTIQTKYISTSSPPQKIEESEILFKGSRDVQKIKPLKLTYEKELSQTKHETDQKSTNNEEQKKYLYMIRKTDSHRYLVREAETLGMFGVCYYESDRYEVRNLSHPNILKVYCQVGEKIVVTEPYEYSLRELISMGRAPPERMSKILRQVKNIRQFIEQKQRENIVLGSLCEIVFYVHGMIKVLPLVEKKECSPRRTPNEVLNSMHSNQ